MSLCVFVCLFLSGYFFVICKMFYVGATLQSVYDDRRSFVGEAQHDDPHGTEIQQSPAETSEGTGAPLQEASRQVTADCFVSNDTMWDLQQESVRDSPGLSPTASGESWRTKSQTVDQLLQLKDEQLCSTTIREEWGTNQVLTSAPISTPKHESQSAKPDPKPDPKPNPSQPSDQPVAAEAIPDPEAEVMVDDAEDEGISQTPPNLDMPDLGEFTSQTSSSPELPTPSTPLTLTPTSSQQTSQPSQSSTASSGPSSIGDIDLSQDWDEVKRQIHKSYGRGLASSKSHLPRRTRSP